MIAKVIVLVLLASLVLIAGMFLLAKSKKEDLGKMFNIVAYGTISLSVLVIVFAIVGSCLMCCMHHNKGYKCESKKECKMKCDDRDKCSMMDQGGKCSKGGSCPMSGGGNCMMGGKGDCGMMGGKGGECSMMGGKMMGGNCCAGHSGATETREIIIEQKVDDAPVTGKETKKTVEIKVDGK